MTCVAVELRVASGDGVYGSGVAAASRKTDGSADDRHRSHRAPGGTRIHVHNLASAEDGIHTDGHGTDSALPSSAFHVASPFLVSRHVLLPRPMLWEGIGKDQP